MLMLDWTGDEFNRGLFQRAKLSGNNQQSCSLKYLFEDDYENKKQN